MHNSTPVVPRVPVFSCACGLVSFSACLLVRFERNDAVRARFRVVDPIWGSNKTLFFDSLPSSGSTTVFEPVFQSRANEVSFGCQVPLCLSPRPRACGKRISCECPSRPPGLSRRLCGDRQEDVGDRPPRERPVQYLYVVTQGARASVRDCLCPG